MKAKSRPEEMALLTKYLRHKQEDLSLVPSTQPRSRAQHGASVIPLLERQGQEDC